MNWDAEEMNCKKILTKESGQIKQREIRYEDNLPGLKPEAIHDVVAIDVQEKGSCVTRVMWGRKR